MKNKIRLVAGLIVAGLIFVRAGFAKDEPSDFDGTWQLTYFEREGKVVKLQGMTRWINTNGKFTVQRGEEVIAAGISRIDPSQSPKAIDVTYTEGPNKGKTFKGIYQVDGDIVKFCRAGLPDDPRPSAFMNKTGSRAFVTVYKRVKP